MEGVGATTNGGGGGIVLGLRGEGWGPQKVRCGPATGLQSPLPSHDPRGLVISPGDNLRNVLPQERFACLSSLRGCHCLCHWPLYCSLASLVCCGKPGWLAGSCVAAVSE